MPKRIVKPPALRVQRFLKKLSKQSGWNFSDVKDARQPGKIKHSMSSIVWTLILGLMKNAKDLRDVETQSQEFDVWGRTLVPDPISDTTLHTEAKRLDTSGLLEKLTVQVRQLQRQKRLNPFGVPMGIATVDGKNLATVNHDAEGTGHRRSKTTEKWATSDDAQRGAPYWLMPAIRVTLTSAEAKPCIYQQALSPGEGEDTAAPSLVAALDQAYGRGSLFEVLDFDAGFTSLSLAHQVNDLGYAYIFGLKGNQGLLFHEAHRVFRKRTLTLAPEAITDWEVRNGKRIRRKLWRTDKLCGFETTVGRWTHLRQTWLVRQETETKDGTLETEDRYFISSLLWNRLSAAQILVAVRNHWGVENDTFNSLDLQWREDHAPWCTQGTAIWGLGLLRLMAYNMVQLLRKKVLRKKRPNGTRAPLVPWRTLFDWLSRAIIVPKTKQLTPLSPD